MPLGKRTSRIQVLVDGMEVELRTPEGEKLTTVRDATITLTAGEMPTIDLTFSMPSINADVRVGSCWMVCPLCSDQINHQCGEDDEHTTIYRPLGKVTGGIVAGGGSVSTSAGGTAYISGVGGSTNVGSSGFGNPPGGAGAPPVPPSTR